MHRASVAVIGDETLLADLKDALSGSGITAMAGASALVEAAVIPADCVMAAIVGAAGLRPTFAAAGQGRRIALANKECLVSAGHVFTDEIARSGAELLPGIRHRRRYDPLACFRLHLLSPNDSRSRVIHPEHRPAKQIKSQQLNDRRKTR